MSYFTLLDTSYNIKYDPPEGLPVTMTEIDIDATETVDARGAACPGPLMDLIGRVRSVESGDVVLLLSDNEQSLTDVSEWVDETDNELLAVDESGDQYEFYVEKA
jgi:TusA-related sulfurtransferase